MAEALKSIPLSQLVPSGENVRKTGAETGLEELVANIASNGLRTEPDGSIDHEGEWQAVRQVRGDRRRSAARRPRSFGRAEANSEELRGSVSPH